MIDRPVTEEKAYAYITRKAAQTRQLLVFEHANEDVGVQVPKGTIEEGKLPVKQSSAKCERKAA